MTKTRQSPPPPQPPSDPSSATADHPLAAPTTVRDRAGRSIVMLHGHPLPFGASETSRGLNFAVFSSHAAAMTLVLYQPHQTQPCIELPLDPAVHRTGHVWHLELQGIAVDMRYGWRAAGGAAPRDLVDHFDPRDVLIDPYAACLTGGSRWGALEPRDGGGADPPLSDASVPTSARGAAPRRRSWRSLAVYDRFDWQGTRPPRIPLADKVIYELHVRGFTRHPTSGVAQPGTYRALVEKIPYLKELGVTTVELLPVYEFDELENPNINPLTGERLHNFWGYNPICFLPVKAAYATNGRGGRQVEEFKTMVRDFHRAGLEVFLDVVFNHTAEGRLPPGAPSLAFRGLDNDVYYMIDPDTGRYLDYSGCGNTLNCNHPVVRNLIIDALRYWVAEMHVDGFRFDLASILGRGPGGEVLARPPVLERIAADPVLADATLIAEAWDAAGLYQVGTFPAWGRFAEWNGPYRDELRHFVRGDGGFSVKLAARLAGSADLFEHSGRAPAHSINFVTCHDGFTLADLVSYDRKHNEANGENNRDGMDDNVSWNCGDEGPTDDPAVLALRARQIRNFLTLLLLSQGTPMLLAGDEVGRTQRGNNNAYCQDNEISWIDWGLLATNRDLFRFAKLLIAFRRAHPVLRQNDFLTGKPRGALGRPDVTWHGVRLAEPDWGPDSRSLAMHLAGEHAPEPDCDVYLAANGWEEDLVFALPAPRPGSRWVRVVDTAEPSPGDIAEPGQGPELADRARMVVRARSCVVLRSIG